MNICGRDEEIDEFCQRRRKSLIEGVIGGLAGSLALTGEYGVDLDVHPFPFHNFIFFEFKIIHKDEEYSLHSKSTGGKGYYFGPNLN